MRLQYFLFSDLNGGLIIISIVEDFYYECKAQIWGIEKNILPPTILELEIIKWNEIFYWNEKLNPNLY